MLDFIKTPSKLHGLLIVAPGDSTEIGSDKVVRMDTKFTREKSPRRQHTLVSGDWNRRDVYVELFSVCWASNTPAITLSLGVISASVSVSHAQQMRNSSSDSDGERSRCQCPATAPRASRRFECATKASIMSKSNATKIEVNSCVFLSRMGLMIIFCCPKRLAQYKSVNQGLVDVVPCCKNYPFLYVPVKAKFVPKYPSSRFSFQQIRPMRDD